MPNIAMLRKAALAAAAGLGIYGATEQDAEAVMLPQVRKLMEQMAAKGGKKLFHYAYQPEELMTRGVVDPKIQGHRKESHKPMAFYATDQIQKIPGHLSFLYKDTDTTEALRRRIRDNWDIWENYKPENQENIIRVIMKPDAAIREIPESYMHNYNKELKSIRRRLLAQEGKGPGDLEWNSPLNERTLTQHWQDLVDGLKISGVDDQSDVAEHLLLNPEKIGGMFWENKVWTPEQGTQEFGPMKKRKFGYTSRKGESRRELGPPPKIDTLEPRTQAVESAAPEDVLAEKLLAKPLKPVTRLLPKVDFTTSQLTGSPGGGFYNAEPGSIEFMTQFKKDLNTLQTLQNDPNIKHGFAYSNVKKAAKQLHDMYLQSIPKQVKKYIPGAIATALGVGSVFASPDQAEAMPLGKLKALTKEIPNTLRSEDAFYKLLGHKLNLSMRGGPRQPYEVVDILKNPDNDWRYVIVKDAQGKRHQLPMTKDYLNVYLGAKGTQDYMQKFGMQGLQGKKIQALKSLTKKENTREATSHVNDKDFRLFNASQMEKAREIDPKLVNDYAYVKVLGNEKGQSLYMPREYANFLAQKGFVKILKH